MRGLVCKWAVVLAALALAGQASSAQTASDLESASAAAHRAADQFTTMAKDAATTGKAPRQSDPQVAPLLDAVFDTAALPEGVPTSRSQILAINDWLNSALRVGSVYVFAGSGTIDPVAGVALKPEALAERNAVAYAPEVGRFCDAELNIAAKEAAWALAQDPAAFQEGSQAAKGLSQMRDGVAQMLVSALGLLGIDGLGDDWRRARVKTLLAIAPSLSRFLTADRAKQVRAQAAMAASLMTDPQLKAQVERLADTFAAAPDQNVGPGR